MMSVSAAFTTPISSAQVITASVVSIQEKKIQIKPDALPNPVKQTITIDETLKDFPIAEAWQFKSVDGVITFKVAFENGSTDKLWKTYDPEGNEIKE